MRNPPLVLIADDNEANRDILARRLEAHGYQLIMAADGEEALACARDKLPDLILLDVMMPKMDGLAVCRNLKLDKALPFIPIILVTARTDTKDVVAGLDMGADEYLTKPVDQAALVATFAPYSASKSCTTLSMTNPGVWPIKRKSWLSGIARSNSGWLISWPR